MATWVDELYADWADYEGENRENGGGRGGWREEEKGEDEEEELATREDEQFTLGREEASSARARLQFPNRETPVPLCIVSTFRYRCFLMRHRLGLLGRNASPPSRAAWRAGVGEKWGSQILFGKHRGRGRSASPEREEGGGDGQTLPTRGGRGFETGPGRNHAIKGVTAPHPTFSGHSAQLIPHCDMDVSALQVDRELSLTFSL